MLIKDNVFLDDNMLSVLIDDYVTMYYATSGNPVAGHAVSPTTKSPSSLMSDFWKDQALHIAEKVKPIFDSYFGEKNWCFAGSFNLLMHGMIVRPVHDIDIIVFDNYYGGKGAMELKNGNALMRTLRWKFHTKGQSESASFHVGDNHVKCLSLNLPELPDIAVDAFYIVDKTISVTDGYADTLVENVDDSIKKKMMYLNRCYHDSTCTVDPAKHQNDINYILVCHPEYRETYDLVMSNTKLRKEHDNVQEEYKDVREEYKDDNGDIIF